MNAKVKEFWVKVLSLSRAAGVRAETGARGCVSEPGRVAAGAAAGSSLGMLPPWDCLGLR